MDIQYERIKGVNPFLDDYIEQNEELLSFYDYGFGTTDLKERAKELSNRHFNREELCEVLSEYNRRFTDCSFTFDQIENLKDETSLVIAGGQQAGLFTGPLYTINKIISILVSAADAEKELGIPVVPVFWIAGEDHDIDEINHIYVHYKDELKRLSVRERNDIKIPASLRPLKKDDVKEKMLESFRHLRETAYTAQLLDEWNHHLENSETYVDFFASLVHHLFKGTGIVLMDAQDQAVRKLEQPFFRELVKRNGELRDAFVMCAEKFREAGFGEPVTADPDLSHLFCHENGERLLLYAKDEEGGFSDREGRIELTAGELADKADDHAGLLSNNVVSRPLMQEWLLPVLGFISGPGEIKYWGTLGEAFRVFGFKMPPLLPRMQVSVVDRRTQRYADRLGISTINAVSSGADSEKERWREEREPSDYTSLFEEAEAQAAEVIRQLAAKLRKEKEASIASDVFENEFRGTIERYKKAVDRNVYRNLEPGLTGFDSITAALHPEGGLQERIVNVLPFLNEYGPDLIRTMTFRIREDSPDIKMHTIVYI
ncbi:bacillithiol biosynthesis cysteine-adding enzyme BshC [Alteribacter lacisalsi]|uniref:Putative cysteine ligase BshC n=1 Tax=Alteribacter lacisalsi TaxID=2045244 RepID=A0A2W0H9W4_9BACI|nr:bacillithiol biosynthesis cysteine-adding enzyme BshC [Alteribacter lacisalsi]PYZ97917.1 bacillithiol biosynthesis cysteine-adding enzyme BshC [Alteribacter lacisalsi]